MATRHNHYEVAFEDFLRRHGWPYVAVDEHKRSLAGAESIKSFDFLVNHQSGISWLVEVKGRKFPYDCASGRRYWENWVTREDVTDLLRWESIFGGGFEAMLVFAYWLMPVAGVASEGLFSGRRSADEASACYFHEFRGRRYIFLRIGASAYGRHARTRSRRWDTVFMPSATFRSLVRTIG